MTAASFLARARSFLFVPGDRPERLPKALASGAHAVIVDFEDAVAPEAKPGAREDLQRAWRDLPAKEHGRLLVRINAADTPWHDGDVAACRALGGLGAVVLPKVASAAVIGEVAAKAGTAVLPLVESAEGFAALDAVARANGVLRLAFGHLDFQADIGMECAEDEGELDGARLAMVLASRCAGLPAAVDGVTVALDDGSRLEADTRRSRRFGFGAKLCIHPKQVPVVNATLGPTPAQRDWARRVLAASVELRAGAFRLDGQMVDAPVLQRARRIAQEAGE